MAVLANLRVLEIDPYSDVGDDNGVDSVAVAADSEVAIVLFAGGANAGVIIFAAKVG